MSDFTPESPATKKEDELAQALGHAISRWASVEFNLVAIFAKATGTSNKMAASILRQVRTFSLLLDMCDAAINCRLDGRRELVYWQSLVEYARELSGDRNYMAHHAMILHMPEPADKTPSEPAVPKIGPNILAAMANVDNDIRRVLDQIELGELLIDFQHLVKLLMDFNEALARNDTSHEKYREPVARRRPPRKQRLETARRARSIPPSPSQE